MVNTGTDVVVLTAVMVWKAARQAEAKKRNNDMIFGKS